MTQATPAKSAKSAGGACSSNYFVDDGLPHLYAAVVDRRGTIVYRDPVWGGLNRTSAARVLHSAAPEPPTVRTPPCNAGTGSCAISNPSCLFQEPFPPRLRADLCRALAAVGATDSPFFTDVEAPRDRLLPPPETSYAANTTRVQILEVVPYSSLFPGDDEVE